MWFVAHFIGVFEAAQIIQGDTPSEDILAMGETVRELDVHQRINAIRIPWSEGIANCTLIAPGTMSL